MIFPSDFRLRLPRGAGRVLAMIWLGAGGLGWAQSSLDTVAPPAFPPPLEKLWPTSGDEFLLGGHADRPDGGWAGERPPILPPEVAPGGFSLQFGTEHLSLHFGTEESTALGPVVDLTVPLPVAGQTTKDGKKSEETEPPAWQLGDVSFKRTARSLNLGKTDDVIRKDDLSSQLGKVGGTKNIVASSPLTSGAIIGAVTLVAGIALAIGYYESDGDDRKRRQKARHRRRYHSS